jgi:hypothetical protein
MADISSYPRKAPKLGDLILFSETYDVNAAYPVTGNPTKTTTVGALVSLVEASSGSGISSISSGAGITVNSDTATAPIVSLDYGATNYIISAKQTATSAASTSFIGLGDGTQASKITLGAIPINALTQVKYYVDNTISGGAIFQSGYNASSGLPVLTTGTGISAGFMYTVTVAGSAFYTVALDVGDVLISNKDSPTDVADWTIVEDDVNVYNLSATSGVDKAVLTLAGPNSNIVNVKGSGGTSVSVVSSEIVIAGLEIGATGATALAGNTTTITSDQATAIVANTAKDGITTAQAGEISVNTLKIGYTEAAVSANVSVAANTAKDGITTAQATDITNSVKNDTNPSSTNKVTNIVTLTSYPPAVVDANTLYIII